MDSYDYTITAPLYLVLEDLPKIPESLLDEMHAFVGDDALRAYQQNTRAAWKEDSTTDAVRQGKIKRMPSQAINPSLEKWIQENIISEYKMVKYYKTIDNGDTHEIHTDRTRTFVLMYLIESGG